MSTITLLQNLQKQGSLFHGSPHSLYTIEPRTGRDQTSEIGRKTAVYASRDYRLAVIKAVVRPAAADWSYSWRFDANLLRFEGFGIKCASGFVHILDAQGFLLLRDSRKEEHVSYFPVKPRLIVAVNEQDFRSLPDCSTRIGDGYHDLYTPPNF